MGKEKKLTEWGRILPKWLLDIYDVLNQLCNIITYLEVAISDFKLYLSFIEPSSCSVLTLSVYVIHKRFLQNERGDALMKTNSIKSRVAFYSE